MMTKETVVAKSQELNECVDQLQAIMVDAGIFDDVDTAMMVHPAGRNLIGRLSLTVYPIAAAAIPMLSRTAIINSLRDVFA